MSDQLVFAFVPLCFGGFFFLAGALLLFFTLRTRKKSSASLSWPSTTGTILSSTVRRNSSTDEDGHTNYSFSPIVEYDYSVSGQAFKGKRVHYGITPSTSMSTAQKEADRFTPGMQVPVFYNPDKPNEAVLEKKEVTSKVGLILGVVFMALTLCTCLISVVMVLRGLLEV
jgi:hypothetical protein